MDSQSPLIVWFRQDLRLKDNPALTAAVKTGKPLILLYILDDINPGEWKMGGASRFWLHHSLSHLNESLKELGAHLVLLKGDPLTIVPELMKSQKASAVFWNRCYEPYAIKRDQKLKKLIPSAVSYKASLLYEPHEVLNQEQEFFKVYTPFWKKCLALDLVDEPLPAPRHIRTHKMPSENLSSWHLLPSHPNWARGIEKTWNIGEKAAHDRLKHFLKTGLNSYEEARDRPSLEGTSRLSPHLHFGEISPRQIYKAAQDLPQSAKFLSEIGWREFSYYQLFHFPSLPENPWRAEFADFPWEKNNQALKKWQKGETGYPIVDAGMKELWETGWMHNRVRMIVASFLIKDLFIPWQVGEKWFWDTLVDADLASNAASWQWVAGSGFDAAPFFRIFNPVLQGKKFDHEGHYIKKWLPALKNIPSKFIHEPHQSGMNISYPLPLIDHAKARLKALSAFKHLRKE